MRRSPYLAGVWLASVFLVSNFSPLIVSVWEMSLWERPLWGQSSVEDRLTVEGRNAVRRGLEYLKRHQNSDGSWTDKIGRKVHFAYKGRQGKHIGVTALACMAFLSNGSLPGRGPYAEQVERGLDYVLKHTQTNGFISVNESRMYSHAFASLFLAEIYGMTGMEKVRKKLKRAVSLIVQAQNSQGGWRYQPGAPDADMSITVCQVMALRAAHNAGIHIPKVTIDNAIRYVRLSYNPRRSAFQYQQSPSSRHSFALTAAGVTALYGAGAYDDEFIRSGLVFMWEHLPRHFQAADRFDYYYGVYYGTQAAFQCGGEYWEKWHEYFWRDMLKLQSRDGSWKDLVGRNYGTAMACVILQVPYQYLPIFER
ncbi:MAG: prenyltransferase/squalene oxidase repeat-containing protein [Planctomycetota bacterium]